MSTCYPTGCTPCDGEIEFPENPTNGQRFCVPIGSAGENKCWVYDHCVPGWRAEGPATSPTRYRGLIDVATQDPATDIQAGDWYIQSTDVNSVRPSWTGLSAPVEANDRIIFSGTKWEELKPPNVPYAEEARDGDKPDPDDRMGGIVKLATVGQVEEGTDKCDAVTPYTLKQGIGTIIKDELGNSIVDGTMVITIDNAAPSFCSGSTLTVSAEAEPKSADGKDVIGLFEYTWQGSDDGTNWNNRSILRDHTATTSRMTQHLVEDYTGDPAQLRVQVKFTDLYGNELVVTSDPIIPVAGTTSQLVDQPQTLDLSTNTTGNFTVTHTGIEPNTVRWFVNGSIVSGANTPDLGYTFSNWETTTLGVTRTDENAGTYPVRVEIENGADCTPLLQSNTVQLTGPDATQIVPPNPVPEFGAVGSLRLTGPRFDFNSSNGGLDLPTPSAGSIYTRNSGPRNGFYTSWIPSGQKWMCLGSIVAASNNGSRSDWTAVPTLWQRIE